MPSPRWPLHRSVAAVVGLLRTLWQGHLFGPPFDAKTDVVGSAELAKQICDASSGQSLPAICEQFAVRWLVERIEKGSSQSLWSFRELAKLLLPTVNPREACYFAIRAIRRTYPLPLSPRTARLAHEFGAAMGQVSDKPRVPAEIAETLGQFLSPSQANRSDPYPVMAFLEICLVLDLFEIVDRRFIAVKREAADSEYLLSHIFGLQTEIPGFDDLFGGGGIIFCDKDSAAQENAVAASQTIGARTVLCIGPLGSGKSLLSLQYAVEVARKGGVALVLGLEQTDAESQYALESVGISTADSSFRLVCGPVDPFVALSETEPEQGALVFLRVAREKTYFDVLHSIEKSFPLLSNYPVRLLVLDPVNAFLLPEGTSTQVRTAVRGLFEAAKRANVNVWFTSEQMSRDAAEANRFEENVADTVIHLETEYDLDQQRRFIEITKSRFQREHSGRHSFEIHSEGGIHVYPSSSVIAQPVRTSFARPEDVKVPFGILGAESVLGPEPLERGDVVVLAGPGKAKTMMGAFFLLYQDGSAGGDSKSIFISDYSPARMRRFLADIAATTRYPIDQVIQCNLPTGYVEPGLILERIRQNLEKCSDAKSIRVLIANMARWEETIPFLTKDAGFGMALINLIRGYGATSVIVAGDSTERGSHLHDTILDQSDFLLEFHKAEFQGRVSTTINAVKTREMRHQRESFEVVLQRGVVALQPAPLIRAGKPVRIRLFLHSETSNHRTLNDRMLAAVKAILSPDSDIEVQHLRFDPGLLAMNRYSAVDELQIIQLDEFQVPGTPSSTSPPDIFYTFDARSHLSLYEDRLPYLKERMIFAPDNQQFIAVPFYVNIGVLAIHTAKFARAFGTKAFPQTWGELANLSCEWEDKHDFADGFFFACPVYGEGVESYNCLFFEILHEVSPANDACFEDISIWFDGEKAEEAACRFHQLCARSHTRGYKSQDRTPEHSKGRSKLRDEPQDRIDAVVARHWYNTLNQRMSEIPGERHQYEVRPLFGNITCAGEWYLTIPSHSASPQVALRLIQELTEPVRETQRVGHGVGLPTRAAYYESGDASVSNYFNFSRAQVGALLTMALRRSRFKQYQRYSDTIASHLQWILEIPDSGTFDRAAQDPQRESNQRLRAEIKRSLDSLVKNLRFLGRA